MKQLKISLFAIFALFVMSGCGSIGMVGAIYHGVTQPVAVTSNVVGHKVGTATCVSVLGLVAVGDAGVAQAAKDGNITQISHVDVKTTSVLGVFTSQKFFVYGE